MLLPPRDATTLWRCQGIFLTALVLSDGLFASRAKDSIRRVVNAKRDSLATLDDVSLIQTLGFCVSFPSVSDLVGYYCQITNTITDGSLVRHKNSLSVSVPSISDLSLLYPFPRGRGSAIRPAVAIVSRARTPDIVPGSCRTLPLEKKKKKTQDIQQSCVFPSRAASSGSTPVSAQVLHP